MAPGYRFFPLFPAFLLFGIIILAATPPGFAQQAAPAPSVGTSNPECLATADEVVKELSQITGWGIKTPLKKSSHSRADIQAYIIKQRDDEKDAEERSA